MRELAPRRNRSQLRSEPSRRERHPTWVLSGRLQRKTADLIELLDFANGRPM
jgi:hypothetical protein